MRGIIQDNRAVKVQIKNVVSGIQVNLVDVNCVISKVVRKEVKIIAVELWSYESQRHSDSYKNERWENTDQFHTPINVKAIANVLFYLSPNKFNGLKFRVVGVQSRTDVERSYAVIYQ